jgi:hypothetical protein
VVEDVQGAAPRPGPPPPPGEPLAGHEPRQIGPYTLISRLGAGGMGTVYLARGQGGRLVAVKVIRPDLAADEEFRRRFRQEVSAARRVAPFCTAEVLDADPDASAPYLVTEFIDGLRLDQAIARGGPLTSSTLTGLAVGVATALTAIHRAGLVHRDLKPSNVLLSLSGPRVIDFGIAQAVDGTKAKPTSWGFGSAGWMAPEQINGHPIGPAADVFTWGILIAYAGSGLHPFGEGQDIDLAYRTVQTEPNLVGLSSPLRELVVAALVKDPDARPSARDLLLALVERGPTGAGGRPPADQLLGLAADKADVMASGAVAELTGPDPGGVARPAPGVARTRVAPPGYGDEQSAGAGPGLGANAGIVEPRPPSTPVVPNRRWPAGAPAPWPPQRDGAPGWPGGPARRPGGGGPGQWGRGSRIGLILTIALVVLGIVAIALIATNPSPSDEPGSQPSASSSASASPTGAVRRDYRDGQLQFDVQSVRCGVDKLGSGLLARHPDGQYCLVKVDVRNIGTATRTLVHSRQFLYDQSGGQHQADYLARFFFQGETLWDSIDPGERVQGTLVFDMPVNASPLRLELHDGLLSDGVNVPI